MCVMVFSLKKLLRLLMLALCYIIINLLMLYVAFDVVHVLGASTVTRFHKLYKQEKETTSTLISIVLFI